MMTTTGARSCFRNNTMMAEMIIQKKLKGLKGLSLPCNFSFYMASLFTICQASFFP
jgi:hypothetical protein